MTDTKHTPGTWLQEHRLCRDGMYRTQVFPAVDPSNTIATIHWHSVEREKGVTTDRAANARIIAAAPDMLEALKYLFANADLTHGDKLVACEAIAKAKGQAND